MKKAVIAIIVCGLCMNTFASSEAIYWLTYNKKTEEITIKNSKNGTKECEKLINNKDKNLIKLINKISNENKNNIIKISFRCKK